VNDQELRETFFYNQMHHSDSKLKKGYKNGVFIVDADDDRYKFKIEGQKTRGKHKPEMFYVVANLEKGDKNIIPLWLFGFLY
jgi:hypothetical protein